MDLPNEDTDKHITEFITEYEAIELFINIHDLYLDIINNQNSSYKDHKISRIIIRYIKKTKELQVGTIGRGGSFRSIYYNIYNGSNLTDHSISNIELIKNTLCKIAKCDLMNNKPNLHMIYHINEKSLIFSNRFSEIKKLTNMYYYYIYKN